MKALKENSETYNRILEAENMLDEINLRITYYSVSDGIAIQDLETNMVFFTENKEINFPRSVESRFITNEEGD